jgi:hypothetical protein
VLRVFRDLKGFKEHKEYKEHKEHKEHKEYKVLMETSVALLLITLLAPRRLIVTQELEL